ncbi:MAG: pyridoxamine 5'-phosphate oxidase family protein [Candidatus Thermoplasmatota archaeon]|jgi:nitroimidazol reductase NimA-like FMN-containing flavoprotein (pyridoxamine 5'-phosphate oxidase superfamily)
MKELSEPTCKTFLGEHRFGIMALAKGGDAYAVPLFFAYDGKALYFHSHPGEKDAFLMETHEGCFVVVDLHGEDDWTSVQATGRVEKITLSDDAVRALNAMAENPFPPEFGVDAKGNPKRSSDRMYLWMMTPRKLTGRSSRSLIRVKDAGEG